MDINTEALLTLASRMLRHEPEQAAIIAPGKIWTYGELAVHAGRVADLLRKHGIGQGMRVGILLGNSAEFAYSLLGVWSVGASAVLLSTYFREHELRRYCEVLTVDYVLTDALSETLLHATFVAAKCEADLNTTDIERAQLFRLGMETVEGAPAPTGEAIVQFTSGVAGLSKIIGRTAENIVNEIKSYSATVALTIDDRILCLTPLFHAYGLVNGLLPALAGGAQVVLTGRFSPREVSAIAAATRPTIVLGVPFMFDLLVETEGLAENVFSHSRFCFSAGAKLGRVTAEAFRKRYGRIISQLYGSTETGIIALNRYASGSGTIDSVGQPVLGREVEVVDDNDKPCTVGTTGNLRIRSQGTTPGYIGANELTAAAFRDGWYYTGDIGMKDGDGNITITGRKATFINVGGMKVDPFEVEAVLRTIPGVRDAAVVGKTHGSTGNHNEIVKAFIVSDQHLSRRDVLVACRQKIAEYKVPREVDFVDQLPRSPMGKLLVKYLLG
jgi:long-chain acyl-CoA synthetase